MSFLGVLKGIGKVVLGIASSPIVESGISIFNPALGAVYNRIVGAMIHIEALHAAEDKTGTGAEKLAFVLQDFEQGLTIAKDLLATQHKQLVYDSATQATAISAQAAAFNAFVAFKASIQIVDL